MPAAFEEDVAAYAEAGFQAMEIWLAKVDAYLEKGNTVQDAGRLMSENGLAAAGACFSRLTFAGAEEQQKNMDALRGRLEMCQAMGAETLVVIPGVLGSPPTPQTYDTVAEGLAECGEVAEPYGVSLAIEFIKGADLIGSVRTAMDVARRTGRNNVGVLLDTFHFHIGISKVADILEMKKDELKLVHFNDCRDVYRETAADNMRVFPGDGVFPLKEILGAISRIGYQGYLSLEVFDQQVWDMDVKEAARLSFEKTSAFLAGLDI